MAKQKVSIGPWSGGLNLRADDTLVRDNELISATNVVVRSDGTVVNRPGFQTKTTADIGVSPLRAASGADKGERLDVLGIVNDSTFLVGRASWSVTNLRWETNAIYKGTISTNNQSQTITWGDTSYTGTNVYVVKVIDYINDVYLIPSSTVPTMYKATGQAVTLNFITLTAVTLPAGLLFNPGGQTVVGQTPSVGLAFIWKDRLFICNTDRVYYSQATNFSVWDYSPGLGGFFDVGADASNDLNYITSVVLSGDSLHIFKTMGTYGFTFQTDPGTDGYLRVINQVQGAYSAVTWRNRIFTVDSKSVYEYTAGQFIDIANKLDLVNNNVGYGTFTQSNSILNSLHVVNDFLVLGPLIAENIPWGFSGRYYAMNLNNGAWVKWDAFGGYFHYLPPGETDTLTVPGFAGTVANTQNQYYYFGTGERGTALVFMNFNESSPYITDGRVGEANAERLPRYYFETKRYTFNNDVAFKKVYRVQFDRGLGIDDDNVTPADTYGGFGVKYTVPSDLLVSSSEAHSIQTILADHFGNMAGSTFRCLSFSLFYEYGIIKQQTHTVSALAAQQYKFKINGMFVYVDERADFDSVSQLATT
jgi:hypothetical protein